MKVIIRLLSKLLSVLIPLLFLSLANAQQPAPPLAQIKIAAEAGDPIAQDKLAEAFQSRFDTKQAEVWYRKASEQGYAHAQGKLGNLLLNRSRMSLNNSPAERVATGADAMKWIALAANQGDKRGQADLADIYLEGKLVKQDLVEAYKWGELAAHGSMIDTAAIAGRSCRDAAILKMNSDQIAEARKRVAAFVPHQLKKSDMPMPPDPDWAKQLKLKGISGAPQRRLALINNQTFETGERSTLNLDGKRVLVRCVEIRESSVIISIPNLEGTRELKLSRE